jgi:hypothetical protein
MSDTADAFPIFVRLMHSVKPHWNIVIMLCLQACTALGQMSAPDSVPLLSQKQKQQRQWLVGGTQVALWTGSYIALNQAWYADYPKKGFHTFNDWGEWQQMDKAGHIWTAYTLGRYSTALWRWAGMKDQSAIVLGGVSAIAYQSIIEIQDGFSEEWGFSWGDMAANAVGAAAYAVQELTWKEQRLQIKFNYHPYAYPADLVGRRNELFGESTIERMLKDYNSQTYWLSGNLNRFLPGSKIPKWLNLSLGYSADLMLAGKENKWEDDNGNMVDYTQYDRVRRYYLSFDIDLTRIHTRSKFLNSLLFTFNAVKIPAPTLEFNNQGRFAWHWLK